MTFNKRVFAFLILFAGILQLTAAGFPKPKFIATYSKSEAKAGDVIDLIIKFEIAEGFHVYSEKSDCPEYDGPIRAQLEFLPDAAYELVGTFKGIGDHMVKEEEIWNCSTGEFTAKGEFRQKIRVLKGLKGISVIFNGQICNESGCENLRDIAIQAPPVKVQGTAQATTPVAPIEPKSTIDKNTGFDTPGDIIDTPVVVTKTSPTSSVLDYQKKEALTEIKTFNGKASEEKGEGMMGLFILAFLSGLTALLTPCVFPMIPMTVSFFIRNKNRAIALRDTFVFAFSIIALYTIVGTIVAFAFGANAANWLSTHWAPNIFSQ